MSDRDTFAKELIAQSVKKGLISASPPFPTWDEMANLMEMESLSIGGHAKRDEDRYRVATFSVPWVWSVEVCPHLHPVWRLAGATAIGQEFRGVTTTNWTKAVLATHEDSAVVELERDRIVEAIGALDLLDDSDHSSLDGVSYRVKLTSKALRITVEFANPSDGPLLALEREILDLTRLIARSSGKPALTSRWGV